MDNFTGNSIVDPDNYTEPYKQGQKTIYKYLVSNCCGAEPYADYKLQERCPKCKEHCDYVYEDER